MSFVIGALIYFFVRTILFGFYTVDQNERAVKTSFGRAHRLEGQSTLTDSIAESLNSEERERYQYPQVRVIGPGLHFKMPWERVYKVSIATDTMNMAFDPENPAANHGGTSLEAVTHDQLNIGLTGQIRFRVCERNLYAYIFGVKNPLVHITGYFVSVLREKISNFKAKEPSITKGLEGLSVGLSVIEGVSINDLRKNLRDINDIMVRDCLSSAARYGIILEASLITGIEPPKEVESALAAINTAFNNVSSEISLAKAAADQTIVQSRRAVEIETLKAQAEVEPLIALADQLNVLKQSGSGVLASFVRNVRMATFQKAKKIILEKDQTVASNEQRGGLQ